MKIIITGGLGFIGSHAAAAFHRDGWDVVVVDNMSRPGTELNRDWLRSEGVPEFARLDVRDQEAVADLFHRHEDADAVLHLAGQVAVTQSVLNPRHDFENNALGTLNVLEGARRGAGGRPAVVYSSTNKIYGSLEHLEIARETGGGRDRYALRDRPSGVSESEPLNFHSPYGCSKGAGDQYVRDYARVFGMKTVSCVQSCIYGTRQYGVEDQGWVAHFMIAALLDRPVTIYGDGRQARDLLWVDDLIELYKLAVAKAGEPGVRGEGFNVGGGPDRALSLLELTADLERRTGRPARASHAAWRPGDQRVFVADTRKAEERLGWRPRVSVSEGLDRLWEWLSENRGALRGLPARMEPAPEGSEAAAC